MGLEHFSAVPTITLETGEEDRDTEEVYKCSPMETRTLVNGAKTRDMERVSYCGGQEDNIQVKWRLEGCMVRER